MHIFQIRGAQDKEVVYSGRTDLNKRVPSLRLLLGQSDRIKDNDRTDQKEYRKSLGKDFKEDQRVSELS
jgi:hypothetical protein